MVTSVDTVVVGATPVVDMLPWQLVLTYNKGTLQDLKSDTHCLTTIGPCGNTLLK